MTLDKIVNVVGEIRIVVYMRVCGRRSCVALTCLRATPVTESTRPPARTAKPEAEMAGRPNAPDRPVLVHLMCTKEDGTSVLHRAWADLTFVRRRNGEMLRLDVELIQDAVYGYAFGQATTQEWDRINVRSAELAANEWRAQRDRDRDGWRRRVESARTLVEKWGLPALHLQCVAGEEGPRSRRRRREDEVEEAQESRSRRRQWEDEVEEASEPRQRRRVDTGSNGGGVGTSLAGWAHDRDEEEDESQA